MNKLGLLKVFCENSAVASVEIDAVRLYMLLLARCRENGRGQVRSSTVQNCLGNDLSPAALKNICLSLEQLRLVKFYSLPPDNLIYRLTFH